MITPGTQSIFHLASVVSAGAQADFDLGWRVNLEGARSLLELARNCTRPPRLVAGWPVKFRTPRALGMGFKADRDVDSVIRAYIAEEGIKVE